MSIQTDDFGAPGASVSRRVVNASPASPNEEAIERALRPKQLDEYVGQTKIRDQLEGMGIPVFAAATRDTLAIFRMIEGLGTLVGRRAGADSLARSIRSGGDLNAVRAPSQAEIAVCCSGLSSAPPSRRSWACASATRGRRWSAASCTGSPSRSGRS